MEVVATTFPSCVICGIGPQIGVVATSSERSLACKECNRCIDVSVLDDMYPTIISLTVTNEKGHCRLFSFELTNDVSILLDQVVRDFKLRHKNFRLVARELGDLAILGSRPSGSALSDLGIVHKTRFQLRISPAAADDSRGAQVLVLAPSSKGIVALLLRQPSIKFTDRFHYVLPWHWLESQDKQDLSLAASRALLADLGVTICFPSELRTIGRPSLPPGTISPSLLIFRTSPSQLPTIYPSLLRHEF